MFIFRGRIAVERRSCKLAQQGIAAREVGPVQQTNAQRMQPIPLGQLDHIERSQEFAPPRITTRRTCMVPALFFVATPPAL